MENGIIRAKIRSVGDDKGPCHVVGLLLYFVAVVFRSVRGRGRCEVDAVLGAEVMGVLPSFDCLSVCYQVLVI